MNFFMKMDLLVFLQRLTDYLNDFAGANSESDRNICCQSSLDITKEYLKREKDFKQKTKALKQLLQFFTAIRPLCETSNQQVDSLGQTIFLECAKLVLDFEFQQSDDDTKNDLRETTSNTFIKLQGFMISQIFLVLQCLIVNGWNLPTLSAMMTAGEVEEDKALTYIQSGEFPEIFKLRIEILMEQQCEDLALNLCSWLVRSPVFAQDVFVRKTHLLLLYKQGHEEFHNSCLKVPCCVLVIVLAELESEAESRDALLVICQTALLHNWLHPEETDTCCTETMLRCSLKLESEQQQDTQGFLNSVNKILQLSVNNDQRRLLIDAMVALFGSKYMQFCTEAGLSLLKKERFSLDSCKIKQDEQEADRATHALLDSCRILARLFAAHEQMLVACLMTVFYLEPDTALFQAIKKRLEFRTTVLPPDPVAPPSLDSQVYKETYCVVDMLRPAQFNPCTDWTSLQRAMAIHMLESGFKFQYATASFVKIQRVRPKTPTDTCNTAISAHTPSLSGTGDSPEDSTESTPSGTGDSPESSTENTPCKTPLLSSSPEKEAPLIKSPFGGTSNSSETLNTFRNKTDEHDDLSSRDNSTDNVKLSSSHSDAATIAQPKMSTPDTSTHTENISQNNANHTCNAKLESTQIDDVVPGDVLDGQGQHQLDRLTETLQDRSNYACNAKPHTTSTFNELQTENIVVQGQNQTNDATERINGTVSLSTNNSAPPVTFVPALNNSTQVSFDPDNNFSSPVTFDPAMHTESHISSAGQSTVQLSDTYNTAKVCGNQADVLEHDTEQNEINASAQHDMLNTIETHSSHSYSKSDLNLAQSQQLSSSKVSVSDTYTYPTNEQPHVTNVATTAIRGQVENTESHSMTAKSDMASEELLYRANGLENEKSQVADVNSVINANVSVEGDGFPKPDVNLALATANAFTEEPMAVDLNNIEPHTRNSSSAFISTNSSGEHHLVGAHRLNSSIESVSRTLMLDSHVAVELKSNKSNITYEKNTITNTTPEEPLVGKDELNSSTDSIMESLNKATPAQPPSDFKSTEAHVTNVNSVVPNVNTSSSEEPLLGADELNSSTESILRPAKQTTHAQLPVISLETLNHVLTDIEGQRGSGAQQMSADQSGDSVAAFSPPPHPQQAAQMTSPLLGGPDTARRTLKAALAGLPASDIQDLGSNVDVLIRKLLITKGLCASADLHKCSRAKLRMMVSRLRESEGQSPEVIKLRKLLVLEGMLKKSGHIEESALNEQENQRLKDWFHAHENNPVPNAEERRMLCEEVGITERVLHSWLSKYKAKMVSGGRESTPGPTSSEEGTVAKTPEMITINLATKSGEKSSQNPNEVQFLESQLACTFCGKQYDSIVLRRRHESFFCQDKPSHVSAEDSSPAYLIKDKDGSTYVHRYNHLSPPHKPRQVQKPPKPTLSRVPVQDRSVQNRSEEVTRALNPKVRIVDTVSHCRFCRKYFKCEETLKTHTKNCARRRQHIQKKRENTLRDIQETKRAYNWSAYQHKARMRKCRFCAQTFQYLQPYRRHEKWCSTQEPEAGFVEVDDGSLCICKYCQRIYDSRRNLNMHLVQCHPEIYDEPEPEQDGGGDAVLSDNEANAEKGDNGSSIDMEDDNESILSENRGFVDDLSASLSGDDASLAGDNRALDTEQIDVDIEGHSDEEVEEFSSIRLKQTSFQYGAQSNWQCQKCHEMHRTFPGLMSHLAQAHGICESPYLFRCPLCGIRNEASHPQMLIRHVVMDHHVPGPQFKISDVMVRLRPGSYVSPARTPDSLDSDISDGLKTSHVQGRKLLENKNHSTLENNNYNIEAPVISLNNGPAERHASNTGDVPKVHTGNGKPLVIDLRHFSMQQINSICNVSNITALPSQSTAALTRNQSAAALSRNQSTAALSRNQVPSNNTPTLASIASINNTSVQNTLKASNCAPSLSNMGQILGGRSVASGVKPTGIPANRSISTVAGITTDARTNPRKTAQLEKMFPDHTAAFQLQAKRREENKRRAQGGFKVIHGNAGNSNMNAVRGIPGVGSYVGSSRSVTQVANTTGTSVFNLRSIINNQSVSIPTSTPVLNSTRHITPRISAQVVNSTAQVPIATVPLNTVSLVGGIQVLNLTGFGAATPQVFTMTQVVHAGTPSNVQATAPSNVQVLQVPVIQQQQQAAPQIVRSDELRDMLLVQQQQQQQQLQSSQPSTCIKSVLRRRPKVPHQKQTQEQKRLHNQMLIQNLKDAKSQIGNASAFNAQKKSIQRPAQSVLMNTRHHTVAKYSAPLANEDVFIDLTEEEPNTPERVAYFGGVRENQGRENQDRVNQDRGNQDIYEKAEESEFAVKKTTPVKIIIQENVNVGLKEKGTNTSQAYQQTFTSARRAEHVATQQGASLGGCVSAVTAHGAVNAHHGETLNRGVRTLNYPSLAAASTGASHVTTAHIGHDTRWTQPLNVDTSYGLDTAGVQNRVVTYPSGIKCVIQANTQPFPNTANQTRTSGLASASIVPAASVLSTPGITRSMISTSNSSLRGVNITNAVSALANPGAQTLTIKNPQPSRIQTVLTSATVHPSTAKPVQASCAVHTSILQTVQPSPTVPASTVKQILGSPAVQSSTMSPVLTSPTVPNKDSVKVFTVMKSPTSPTQTFDLSGAQPVDKEKVVAFIKGELTTTCKSTEGDRTIKYKVFAVPNAQLSSMGPVTSLKVNKDGSVLPASTTELKSPPHVKYNSAAVQDITTLKLPPFQSSSPLTTSNASNKERKHDPVVLTVEANPIERAVRSKSGYSSHPASKRRSAVQCTAEEKIQEDSTIARKIIRIEKPPMGAGDSLRSVQQHAVISKVQEVPGTQGYSSPRAVDMLKRKQTEDKRLAASKAVVMSIMKSPLDDDF